MSYEKTEIRRPKGINKDLSPYELPPDVWSNGYNVTFRRNRVAKALGYASVWQAADYFIQPLHTIYFTDNVDSYWAYASETQIYKTAGNDANTAEIGRNAPANPDGAGADYNASRDVSWTACNFNNVVLFNNRIDWPQVLNPLTGYMEDLPHWDPIPDRDVDLEGPYTGRWGPNARCEIMRPFKNYLIAMDCYDNNGQREPATLRWSSPAEGGDVPPSWDETLTGEQAGDYWISDTPGRIVDGLTLGDYFVIYKTDSVWLLDLIGGSLTFRFRKLFGDEAGMLTKHCVAEFDGKHFVMSPTGAYVHNAATKEEIMEQWVRDEFFDNVAIDRLLETKVVADHTNREVWVYYTTQRAYNNNADAWPDRALIWNWDTATWTIKDLTGISHIAEGTVDKADVTGDDWDSDTQIWDDDPASWDGEIAFNPKDKSLLLADYDNTDFYANEASALSNGVLFGGFVERIGIDFESDSAFKEITRITPHLLSRVSNAAIEAKIDVTITVEDTQSQGLVTGSSYLGTYDPSIDNYVDCHEVGRYIGLKFGGTDPWILTGYTIWWKPLGNF